MTAPEPNQTAEIEAYALAIEVPASQAEALSGALWGLEPDGIQQDDAGTLGNATMVAGVSRLTVYAPAARADAIVTGIGEILAGFRIATEVQREPIFAQDWGAAWKAHYSPLDIGDRLHIVPAWQPPEAPAGRVCVLIDPGQAFGTGTHETTQLVAELMESRIPVGGTVFDVGTGSALLAIAAVKLGASAAIGVDNDPVAIASARENLSLNAVEDLVEVYVADSPQRLRPGQHPLVLANIISSILRSLRDAIVARVEPGGTLLVSGVLTTEEDAFRADFIPAGWTVVERRTKAEWLALALRAPA